MAQGDQLSVIRLRLAFLSFMVAAVFFASAQDASARCVRLLQPGGWGYQTVCNYTGGGYGGGGGNNYGAMIGAGAAFLGALQDFTNEAQQNQGGGSGAPSQSACRAGYRVISGGGCAPSGAVDCGGGRYCPAGRMCMPRNTCQTPEQAEWDREFKAKQARIEQGKQSAASAELDEIKRRIANPSENETAQFTAALLPPRQANPFARSGASAPPDANPFARRPWDGTTERCGDASPLEKNTAAYFTMCGPKAPEAKAAGYTPSFDPQKLTLWAKQGCGGLMGAEERSCVLKNKLTILLREDPAVRAKCTALEGTDLTRCVDYTYLFGPEGPTGTDLKAVLRGTLATLPDGAPPAAPEKSPAVIAVSAPPSECGPGFGMKPTPGAFGAWSCQRLGVIFLAPDRKTPIDAGSPEGTESVRQFEERINEVAALAAAHAAKEVGAVLSDADRKTCIEASYAAARGVLKGGSPDVPGLCRPMTLAAQAALAYYADAHIDSSNPGVEEMLAAYIDGANADEKKPAFVGIEPSKEQRQQQDCMARGQSPDCAAAPQSAPSPPAVRASDNCTTAELHWKAVEDMKTIALYEDHLKRFPNCAFAVLAAARIEQLRKR